MFKLIAFTLIGLFIFTFSHFLYISVHLSDRIDNAGDIALSFCQTFILYHCVLVCLFLWHLHNSLLFICHLML